METQHKEEIMYALGELKGDVKGVHTRLDTLNSKVAKQEAKIQDLQVVDTEMLGVLKPIKDFDKRIRFAENKIWYIIGIGVATATIFGFIGLSWFNSIQDNITNSAKTAVIEYIESKDFEI